MDYKDLPTSDLEKAIQEIENELEARRRGELTYKPGDTVLVEARVTAGTVVGSNESYHVQLLSHLSLQRWVDIKHIHPMPRKEGKADE